MIRVMVTVMLLWSASAVGADVSFKLEQARLSEVVRLICGEVLHLSYSLPPDLVADSEELTLDLHGLDKEGVRRYLVELLTARGYELRQVSGVWFVRRVSDAPEEFIVYRPVYRSARYLGDVVREVAGDRTLASRTYSDVSASVPAGAPGAPGAQAVPAGQASSLSDKPGTFGSLVDKADIDQMAYKCRPQRCAVIRALLTQLDTPVSEVLLRAAVYEVSSSKGEGSAIQLALRAFGGKVQLSTPLAAPGVALHLVNGDIDALFSALDSDSHFKSITRPFVRVMSGQRARFEVGQKVPVLGAVTTPANGSPVQSIEYRDSGTILTVTPDIRQDVVSLDITQELSTFVQTQTGVNNSPTLNVRKASSQLSLRPGDVVMMGGLESAQDSDSVSGVFGLRLSKTRGLNEQQILLFIEAERI